MAAGDLLGSTVPFVGVLLMGSLWPALPASAHVSAHPSDFETLTLDLWVGPDGLEGIDAAVVPGTTYEPFIATEVKLDIATDVLDALDLSGSGVAIDAEMSWRYHEVGFVVRFEEPALGTSAPLAIDTADLQAMVDDRQLGRLKLSVCGVTPEADPSEEFLASLDVRASVRGRQPAGLDREACEVWILEPGDRPVSIAITAPRRAVGDASEDPGSSDVSPWGPAPALLVAGAALISIAAVVRWRRRPL